MRKSRRKKEQPRIRLEDVADVLTAEEVVGVTGLGRSSTYKALASGDIPSVRIGGRLLVYKAALMQRLGQSNGE